MSRTPSPPLNLDHLQSPTTAKSGKSSRKKRREHPKQLKVIHEYADCPATIFSNIPAVSLSTGEELEEDKCHGCVLWDDDLECKLKTLQIILEKFQNEKILICFNVKSLP